MKRKHCSSINDEIHEIVPKKLNLDNTIGKLYNLNKYSFSLNKILILDIHEVTKTTLLEKNDPKMNEILEKLKYNTTNVTIDDWDYTFKNRASELNKIKSSPDVVNFFQRWKLYVDKPLYVSNLNICNLYLIHKN